MPGYQMTPHPLVSPLFSRPSGVRLIQSYLRIANPGVASPEAFIMLGVSTSRYRDGAIGQFGSGSKHAVNLLLSRGLNPIIISGRLRLAFSTRPLVIKGHDYQQVVVKITGTDENGKSCNRTVELQQTLGWGTLDWDDLSMACREFVANALDGAVEAHDTPTAQSLVQVGIVYDVRAVSDWTQVYIPMTPDIQKFYNELNWRFLHFGRRNLLDKKILPKITADNPDPSSRSNVTRVYKKGVLVATLPYPSVRDYNLGRELRLDESRNASEWDVKYAVAKALANADATDLSLIFSDLISRPDSEMLLETHLSADYLCDHNNSETLSARQEEWKMAWEVVAGSRAVACSGMAGVMSFVAHKGYDPVKVPPTWLSAMRHYGISTENTVLSSSEKAGEVIHEATPAMLTAVDQVWALLEKYSLTNSREKPPVKAFTKTMDAGAQKWGEYREGTVCLHMELGKEGLPSPQLMKVALEEVVHHVTGATDMSRDLQDFLFRLVTSMAW